MKVLPSISTFTRTNNFSTLAFSFVFPVLIISYQDPIYNRQQRNNEIILHFLKTKFCKKKAALPDGRPFQTFHFLKKIRPKLLTSLLPNLEIVAPFCSVRLILKPDLKGRW